MSSNSKILLRSSVLEVVSGLKASKDFSDAAVEAAIEQLKELHDNEFVIQLLLKEVNCQDARFDSLLAIIAREISPQICESESYELLKSKTVPDKKKLFLINNLRDMGKSIDYNDVQTYIVNPDEAIDLETKTFLESARINPEAQIDFLDFFFTVNDNDKKVLLDSISYDFTGDELANVLVPVILHDPKDPIVPFCIEALKKCKSYLAFEPLNYIIENIDDEGLKSQARRVVNELKLMGLREEQSKKELFKESFKGSIPFGYWVSPIDGGDNFSIIFARETNNALKNALGGHSEISTFFTVVNLAHGASACFGFNSISKDEFNLILKRFFGNSLPIELELSVGQRLLEESVKKSRKPPYELLCWRTLTYDTEAFEGDLDAEFKRELEKIELDQAGFEKLIDSAYIGDWFFKYGQNLAVDVIIDKINEHKPKTIGDIDVLIEEALCAIFEDVEPKIFNKKLLMQAYFAHRAGDTEIANILYALIEPSNLKSELLIHIVQKSIYKYFLEIALKPSSGAINIFSKKEVPKNLADPDFYIKLIESEWAR